MPHTHDGHLIATITRGALEICDEFGSYFASAGAVVFCNPDWIHWGRSADPKGWSIDTIYVPEVAPCSNSGSLVSLRESIFFPDIVVQDPRLARQIRHGVALHADGGNEAVVADTLNRVVTHSLENYGMTGSSSGRYANEKPAVRAARDFVDQNPVYAFSLDELSEEVRANKFTLLKQFKRQWGVTPFTYQTIKRIELSRQLLRKGVSLVEVALDCGFADQSHFSRIFKRSTGVTPGRFLCE